MIINRLGAPFNPARYNTTENEQGWISPQLEFLTKYLVELGCRNIRLSYRQYAWPLDQPLLYNYPRMSDGMWLGLFSNYPGVSLARVHANIGVIITFILQLHGGVVNSQGRCTLRRNWVEIPNGYLQAWLTYGCEYTTQCQFISIQHAMK